MPAAAGLSEAARQAVDSAVVLAIDVSGSVSEDRVQLQRQGYANALRNAGLLDAVRGGPLGRIALTFVQWSEVRRQDQAVGWRIIQDKAGAEAFADAIMKAQLPQPGWTSISSAIDFSVRLLTSASFDTARRIIDISSDGANNDGRDPAAARDDAVAAGVTINGLPITEINPGLDSYYRRNVIGGRNAFLIPVHDFSSFTEALLRKLLVEIAGSVAAPGQVESPSPSPKEPLGERRRPG
jgi:hypothetical protein